MLGWGGSMEAWTQPLFTARIWKQARGWSQDPAGAMLVLIKGASNEEPLGPRQAGVFARPPRCPFYWVLGKEPTGPGRPQHAQPHSEGLHQAVVWRVL